MPYDYSRSKIRYHSKASEAYLPVRFEYGTQIFEWDIPIEYRRTGTHLLDKDEDELRVYLDKVYADCNPANFAKWRDDQRSFWASKARADTTKAFYDALERSFDWCSVESDLPKNRNWARRVQDIKEFGYTLVTDTNRIDRKTGSKCTHIRLLPITRGGLTGYELWTPEQRDRIIATLDCFDAFEAKNSKKEALLPDHKFPEIRWDELTRRGSLNHLTEADIRRDFQLITNQRNQQKREVCRSCYQTGQRGSIFGIPYYYDGTSLWDPKIPKRGKAAEAGCVGCPWYDIQKWRESLVTFIKAR